MRRPTSYTPQRVEERLKFLPPALLYPSNLTDLVINEQWTLVQLFGIRFRSCCVKPKRVLYVRELPRRQLSGQSSRKNISTPVKRASVTEYVYGLLPKRLRPGSAGRFPFDVVVGDNAAF